MSLPELLAAWRKGGGEGERPRAASLAVGLGLAAILLLLLSELWPAPAEQAAGESRAGPTAAEYQAGLEERLAGLIAQIEGAGEAAVMVTLESGEERVYALDTQTAQDGARQTHVLLEDGSALEETVYLPAVCGVAVVCDGGGDVRVEARITELLSALLDLPANRICVEQRRR